MRPLRLVAEGFTSFRDPIDVDFEDADFFALVGPTGSGKSSILDAICFALYGAVPRYDDVRLVAPVITQGAIEARVSLTFEIDAEQYVATRVVRRTKGGGASTKEARLEQGIEILAGEARGMNAAVIDLIGLSFNHFTRCVVLPQGDFAEFLHDKPSDRQDLIVKLLDLSVYERMRRRASERAAARENAISLDVHRFESLADCTPHAADEAKALLAGVKRLRKVIAEAADEVLGLDAAAKAAVAEAETAQRVVTLLEAVKVPKAVRTVGKDRAEAVAAQAKIAQSREAAETALTDHGELVKGLPDPTALQQALDAYEQLGEVREQMTTVDVAAAELVPQLKAAQAAHNEAEHAVQHAEADFEAATEETAATRLAAALVVGEACPVCEQIVPRKPKVRTGEKDKAKSALEGARKQEGKARGALDKISRQNDGVAAQRTALAKQVLQLERKVAAAPDAEKVAEQLATVQAARREHEILQTTVTKAIGDERAAASKVAAFDQELAKARRVCDAQRDPLVGEKLDAPTIGADFVADWEALHDWAAEQMPTHKARREAQTALAQEKGDAARDRVKALVEEAEVAGVTLPGRTEPTVVLLGQQAAAAERDAAAEAKRIADGIKESAAIEARIDTAREEVAVAKELANLLRSNRFEQWIVNEALESLVIGASLTLEELSNGQYALAVDEQNEFEVVDHRNADEHRSAKTLSGGETFQASLALSLALADQVGALAAAGAAKLDAIFLDEGFGTLDPDCLDTVAATLETLGGDARMVGIVTHVRDLADRVPVRFEVTKGPRTSTIVRMDA